MTRVMPDYHHLPAQRNSSYDHFGRDPRAALSLGPFASSVPPFPQSATQQTIPRQDGPPFESIQKYHSLMNSLHQVLDFDIIANIPKGFFQVEGKWTCYRRNYFNVSCGFAFKSHISDQPVYLHRYAHPELVMAYAVSISAKTAAANNSESEERGLVQHTPKRDKATESVPGRHVVVPASPPNMGNGHVMDTSSGSLFQSSQLGACVPGTIDPYGQPASQSQQAVHLFERIQFQKATANNGKRRAQQQYFHVVVNLEVNVGRSQGQEDWVLVASKQSQEMVVRGRSPGHYKDNRRNSQTSMDHDGPGGSGHNTEGGGGGSSGAGGHSNGYSYGSLGGSSHPPSLGSTPNSYRHSHHYGSSFSRHHLHHHQVDPSENSASASPESGSGSSSGSSSVTLNSSPPSGTAFKHETLLHRARPSYPMNMHMNINSTQHPGHSAETNLNSSSLCFDRIVLSPILGLNAKQQDQDSMDFHSTHARNPLRLPSTTISTTSTPARGDPDSSDPFFPQTVIDSSSTAPVGAVNAYGSCSMTPSFDFSATATAAAAVA